VIPSLALVHLGNDNYLCGVNRDRGSLVAAAIRVVEHVPVKQASWVKPMPCFPQYREGHSLASFDQGVGVVPQKNTPTSTQID
jgi:hypothetical protein